MYLCKLFTFFKAAQGRRNKSGKSGHRLTNILAIPPTIHYHNNVVIIFICIVNIVVNLGLTNELVIPLQPNPVYI